MSAEKCLSKEARKVWGEEQDVHDTGREFQSAMHEGKKDRSLLLVLHTAWRKVFFRSVCVARSEARGGSLDCREGGPCRFNSFQKSSSLYRRRLHANVGHPISFRTDTFDFVRRLARNIALATESWSLSTRRQSSRVQESQTGPAYSSTSRTRLT